MRRRIAFPCVNRTPITRRIIQRGIRHFQKQSYKIVQISAQQAYNMPEIPSTIDRIIVPNVATIGQVFELKKQGFIFCDVRTTESAYRMREWFDLEVSLDTLIDPLEEKLDCLARDIQGILYSNQTWRYRELNFELNPALRDSFLG
jgi:hypothetical protein